VRGRALVAPNRARWALGSAVERSSIGDSDGETLSGHSVFIHRGVGVSRRRSRIRASQKARRPGDEFRQLIKAVVFHDSADVFQVPP
jgi:hypothetical protein